MRATLTLDDDLAGLLRERAATQGQAFRTVVNQVIRIGLSLESQTRIQDPPRVIPHASGLLARIDPDKMNQLVDDLEMESYADSLSKIRTPKRPPMIRPDVNVLVHAHNSQSPVHDEARTWWDGCLSGPEELCYPG